MAWLESMGTIFCSYRFDRISLEGWLCNPFCIKHAHLVMLKAYLSDNNNSGYIKESLKLKLDGCFDECYVVTRSHSEYPGRYYGQPYCIASSCDALVLGQE